MKNKKTPLSPKKKKILIAALAAAVVALGIGAFFLIRHFTAPEENSPRSIVYFPADYEKDILSDPVYLDFDRTLHYTKDGVTGQFDENNIASASPECRFLMEVIRCVILGDWENYPSFFLDPASVEKKEFTMQELYDIEADFGGVSEEQTENGTLSVLNYRVRYRIHRNNGTYRSGIYSDAKTTQIYQLTLTESGFYKLYRILDVIYDAP